MFSVAVSASIFAEDSVSTIPPGEIATKPSRLIVLHASNMAKKNRTNVSLTALAFPVFHAGDGQPAVHEMHSARQKHEIAFHSSCVTSTCDTTEAPTFIRHVRQLVPGSFGPSETALPSFSDNNITKVKKGHNTRAVFPSRQTQPIGTVRMPQFQIAAKLFR